MPDIIAFNRGRISPLALARTDFKRTALSAEVMTNWLPRALGSMSLRPGQQYIGATMSNNRSVSIPFIYSNSDMARIEITAGQMRVWVNDALVTRPGVTGAITNGDFATDLSGWADHDGAGASSYWANGQMFLLGAVTTSAKRRQQVTVNEVNVLHAVFFDVARGSVTLRIGSTEGGDEYVSETTLRTGNHSIAFTPTGGSFWIEMSNYSSVSAAINGVSISPAGPMTIFPPWAEADLGKIRWDQSGDVLFLACRGYPQTRIERRANGSWSVCAYSSDNGPFRAINISPTTIAPSATTGEVTLTASTPIFRATHFGSLFRLEQTGQTAEINLTGDNQFSDPIRVTGVDGARVFGIIISGTFTATITLQYSVGDPGDWIDAQAGSYTAPVSISYDDTLDNQVIYYRIGIKSGDYTSGSADVVLSYASGTQQGVGRVIQYISPTQVLVGVLEPFGNASATVDWWESYWSERRGWPSAVAFYEGRLWWAGQDRVWGSVSDDFSNFLDSTEGDSGPISRSIGSGPVDNIGWLLALQRLILGAEGELRSARSSSLDEPLTPTNFNLKSISTDGALGVAPIKVGTGGIYASGNRLFEIGYDGSTYDYATAELTQMVPEIGDAGIVRIVIQHKPEKRIHMVRNDGTVGVMAYMRQEDVMAWFDYETDGFVEDACVLPGVDEDQVYYTVRRTVNGSTVRYHEKLAKESQCRGFPDARLADSFRVYQGAATTAINGLSHLEGKTVIAWGWNTVDPFTNSEGEAIGRDLGTFTVTGGAITVPVAVTDCVVGLGYSASYKSAKLAFATADYLCLKKRVQQIGIVARWIHAYGLRYGPDFERMDDLPTVEKWADVDPNDMRLAYDEERFPFHGEWDTDSRICLEAAAPRPVTLMAVLIDMEAKPK